LFSIKHDFGSRATLSLGLPRLFYFIFHFASTDIFPCFSLVFLVISLGLSIGVLVPWLWFSSPQSFLSLPFFLGINLLLKLDLDVGKAFEKDILRTTRRSIPDSFENERGFICWLHLGDIYFSSMKSQLLFTTRNRPLEHQIFWQHHVFGCNSWFYSNQRINALRYLGVMATKNVGCVY
jgi:hypothetical protein